MDETISFGTLGKTGRGVTEYYNVPVSIVFHHAYKGFLMNFEEGKPD